MPPPTLRDLEFIVVFSQVPACTPLMLTEVLVVSVLTRVLPQIMAFIVGDEILFEKIYSSVTPPVPVASWTSAEMTWCSCFSCLVH